MTTQSLRAYTSWVVAVVVGIIGVMFWRGVTDSFELVKATVLWIGALLLVPALIAGRRAWWAVPANSRWWLVPAAFVVWALVSSVSFSDYLGSSLWGQYLRYVGVLTLATSVLVGLAVWICDDRGFDRILVGYIGSALASIAYVVVQFTGNDPYKWRTDSFDKNVFGTMGNPNFSTVWISVALPAAFWLSSRADCGAVVRWLARVTIASGVVAIAALDSFQGNVALIALVIVIIARTCVGASSRGITRVIAVVTSVYLVGVSLLAVSTLRFVGFTVVGIGLLWLLDRAQANRVLTGLRFGRRLGIGLWALFAVWIVVALASVRDRLSANWSQGFVERGDFYRTAIKAIRERPLTGYGLDTFGRYFMIFRPESYARRLPSNLPSSPHSVYLGMFFSGGILLAALFVTMVILGLWKSFTAWKQSKWTDGRAVTLFGTWIALSLICLISVEDSPLLTLFFVFFGAIMRLETRRAETDRVEASRRAGSFRIDVTGAVVAGVLSVIGGFLVLRPMRAGLAAYDSASSKTAGEALDVAQRAVDLMPSVPYYRLQLLGVATKILEQFPDDPERDSLVRTIRDNSLAVARELNYQGSGMGAIANVLGRIGDIESSFGVVTKALANDPYGEPVREFAKQILPKIVSRAKELNSGDLADRAQALLDQLSSAG